MSRISLSSCGFVTEGPNHHQRIMIRLSSGGVANRRASSSMPEVAAGVRETWAEAGRAKKARTRAVSIVARESAGESGRVTARESADESVRIAVRESPDESVRITVRESANESGRTTVRERVGESVRITARESADESGRVTAGSVTLKVAALRGA
jgi:hypothetical protein